MKKNDCISALFFLFLSVIGTVESYRLNLGTFRSPEAGFYPFVACVAMGVFSLLLLLSSARSENKAREKTEGLTFDRRRLSKVLYTSASLIVYPVLLNALGFILCTAMFVIFLLKVIEPKRWFVVIVAAVSISGFSYLVFCTWLGVPLPKGLFAY